MSENRPLTEPLWPREGRILALDLAFWRTERPVGVSFFVRCREDKRTMAFALESLAEMPFPYEVLICLNAAQPECHELAKVYEQTQPDVFRVFKYRAEPSCPGLATWVTPVDSCHYLGWMNNWIVQQSRFCYSFRLDADEIMTVLAKDALATLLPHAAQDPYQAWKFGKQYVHDPRVVDVEAVLFRNNWWACHKYGAWETWDCEDDPVYQAGPTLASVGHLFYEKYQCVVPWFCKEATADAIAIRARYEQLRGQQPHNRLLTRASINTGIPDVLYRLKPCVEYLSAIHAICTANRVRANLARVPQGEKHA